MDKKIDELDMDSFRKRLLGSEKTRNEVIIELISSVSALVCKINEIIDVLNDQAKED